MKRKLAIIGLAAAGLLLFAADNDVVNQNKTVTRTTYVSTAIFEQDENGAPLNVIIVVKEKNTEGADRVLNTYNITRAWLVSQGRTNALDLLDKVGNRTWTLQKQYARWLETNVVAAPAP